jgi:hypothetical protein
MWMGTLRPSIVLMTIGRPQRQPLAMHFMVHLRYFVAAFDPGLTRTADCKKLTAVR